jgi:hypothetical protein
MFCLPQNVAAKIRPGQILCILSYYYSRKPLSLHVFSQIFTISSKLRMPLPVSASIQVTQGLA